MDPIHIKRRAGRTYLVLDAVLDISQARRLHKKLGQALTPEQALTLDASQVTRIDTASLQVFIAFCRRVRDRGLTLKWKSPSESLRATVELLKLQAELGMAS